MGFAFESALSLSVRVLSLFSGGHHTIIVTDETGSRRPNRNVIDILSNIDQYYRSLTNNAVDNGL